MLGEWLKYQAGGFGCGLDLGTQRLLSLKPGGWRQQSDGKAKKWGGDSYNDEK